MVKITFRNEPLSEIDHSYWVSMTFPTIPQFHDCSLWRTVIVQRGFRHTGHWRKMKRNVPHSFRRSSQSASNLTVTGTCPGVRTAPSPADPRLSLQYPLHHSRQALQVPLSLSSSSTLPQPASIFPPYLWASSSSISLSLPTKKYAAYVTSYYLSTATWTSMIFASITCSLTLHF